MLKEKNVEYRFLGRSGLRLSALSYGAWITFGQQIGEEIASDCMKAAYDAGVNFFDNAETYANGNAEIVMGNVIKKVGWKRSDLVISTKIFWGGKGPNDRGLSRKHIFEGVNASLKRLQLDYVDLLYCHRPDLYTPIEETVWAMNLTIQQGKALYWGTSEWSAQQIMEAYAIAWREHLIPPLMEQPEYNMFSRERVEKEYASLCKKVGLGITSFSPLASGLLTGKYNDSIPQDTRIMLKGYDWLRERFESDETRHNITKVRQITAIARELDCSTAQLALAWCLMNPNVSTVITGASRPEQVRENMGALAITKRLTPEVMGRIETVLANKPEPEVDERE
jgi:voltage-dependent potassium channel beta subunit